MDAMDNSGMPGQSASTIPLSKNASFKLNARDFALTKAARFYVYGKTRVSKETFDDEEFRDMLQGYFDAGVGTGEAPFLTKQGLLS